MNHCFTILFIYSVHVFIFTVALKCFQGTTPFNSLVNMTKTTAYMYLAPDCPMNSSSCMKAVDYSKQLIVYSCMTTNCSTPPSFNTLYTPYCYTDTNANNPFCCCYGDGCNSRFMPPYCEALGNWDTWGVWSFCPSTSSSNTMLNIRRRLRTCSPFRDCHSMSQFQCNGNYSEILPCYTNSSITNTTNNTNNTNSNIPTIPPTINSGVGGPIVVDMLQSAKIIASGALSAGLIQSMQVNSTG